eukprot:1639194-Pyramimonas_sp.AAC.1
MEHHQGGRLGARPTLGRAVADGESVRASHRSGWPTDASGGRGPEASEAADPWQGDELALVAHELRQLRRLL